MQGLQVTAQKAIIIGVLPSTKVAVLTASPLRFSSFTEGSCAAAEKDTNIDATSKKSLSERIFLWF
jgi:hypothetical protein